MQSPWAVRERLDEPLHISSHCCPEHCYSAAAMKGILLRRQMKAICTGSSPNFLYILLHLHKRQMGSGPSCQPYTVKSSSCSFHASSTSSDPISVFAVAETEKKLVALPAPYSSRSVCDSAQILSITVAPLSDYSQHIH